MRLDRKYKIFKIITTASGDPNENGRCHVVDMHTVCRGEIPTEFNDPSEAEQWLLESDFYRAIDYQFIIQEVLRVIKSH